MTNNRNRLNSFDYQLAEDLRAELARAKLTVTDLAAKTGLTYSALYQKLSELVAFRAGEIHVISQALGLPTSEVVRRAEEAVKTKERTRHQ